MSCQNYDVVGNFMKRLCVDFNFIFVSIKKIVGNILKFWRNPWKKSKLFSQRAIMYSLHVHYEIYDQVSNTDKVQGVPINMGIQ